MAAPKDGKPGTPIPPDAPTAAHEADGADPGQVEKVKADQKQKQTGKYGSAKLKPYKPPATQAEKDAKPSWIEVKLVNEQGKPVPGEAYRIILPDGETVAEGTLDEKGFVRIDYIDPGTCRIGFPNLDEKVWHPQ